MQKRSEQDRRKDRLAAERFDLAILAARAFDMRAGQQYLTLSGLHPSIVQRFVAGFSAEMPLRMPLHRTERRRHKTDSQAKGRD